MKTIQLTESDYLREADRLGVEVAVLKAVEVVETGGRGGFLEDGRPVILFEGHIFWQQLQKKGFTPEELTTGNEDILYRQWTRRFYCGGADEYDRLARAAQIDEEAALAAASWGMFQLMGFNFRLCGYLSVRAFAEAMGCDEARQLSAFVSYLKAHKLAPLLRNHDWQAFARAYNGPAYAQHHYDLRLERAYRRFDTNCGL